MGRGGGGGCCRWFAREAPASPVSFGERKHPKDTGNGTILREGMVGITSVELRSLLTQVNPQR